MLNMLLMLVKGMAGPRPSSVIVRAAALGARGRGFVPGPHHTKNIKNDTNGYLACCSNLSHDARKQVLGVFDLV